MAQTLYELTNFEPSTVLPIANINKTCFEIKIVSSYIQSIHSCKTTPSGTKNPAAMGIPSKLYAQAKTKLYFMRRTTVRDKSIDDMISEIYKVIFFLIFLD